MKKKKKEKKNQKNEFQRSCLAEQIQVQCGVNLKQANLFIEGDIGAGSTRRTPTASGSQHLDF